MAKTITLTAVNIKAVTIDYANQVVTAYVGLVDASGAEWTSMTAMFYVTMPAHPKDGSGNDLPYPPEWFTIPASYITTLVNMRNDIASALQSKFLV